MMKDWTLIYCRNSYKIEIYEVPLWADAFLTLAERACRFRWLRWIPLPPGFSIEDEEGEISPLREWYGPTLADLLYCEIGYRLVCFAYETHHARRVGVVETPISVDTARLINCEFVDETEDVEDIPA